MHLDYNQKLAQGAFYTPKEWANLAVNYMRGALPKPLEHYIFYDPAGGEGALLDALPHTCECYATTLEYQDVQILRMKGYKAWQFDFLNEDLMELPHILHHAAQCERLVVLTNPPFIKLPRNSCKAQEMYQTSDSVYLFLYRLWEELGASYICSFNKVLDAPSLGGHAGNLHHRWHFLGGFLCSSKEGWGLKGSFPVAFNMWRCEDGDRSGTLEAIAPDGRAYAYYPFDVWERGKKRDLPKRIYLW